MRLIYYVARRLILIIPVVLGVLAISFVITNLIPTNPVDLLMVGKPRDVSTEAFRQVLIEKWGLDKPLYEQFFTYVSNILRGDFGNSIRTFQPVSKEIARLFPATVELSTAAIIISILVGITTGTISATRRNRPADHVSRVLALIGSSMPTFWLGLIAIRLFHFEIPLFPAVGRISASIAPPTHITGLYIIDSLLTGNWIALQSSIWHLLLPAFVLGYSYAGIISRMTRSSMLEVMSQDYIRTAHSKGLSERTVNYRHGLRNALIPTTTVIGLAYSWSLTGTILIEDIFGWPGIGRFALQSITYLDYTAILGISLLIVMIFVTINLVVDILYFFINPRIRN